MASAYVELNTMKKKYAELERKYYYSKGMTIQQCIDVAEITLHNHFGFGPSRNKDFEEKFKRILYEVMEMAVTESDGNGKKNMNDIGFTSEMLDAGLRLAMGDGILPFEDRYAEGRLYERIRDIGR